MIKLSGFCVEGYKAFDRKTPMIDLAPITIILGRNNSGKSALCRAPLFFTHLFQSDARTPFPLEMEGIDFGMTLLDISFNQRIDGFKATLSFHNDAVKKKNVKEEIKQTIENIFSKNNESVFKQLQKLFIRASDGQHVLHFSEPEHVINSDFFKIAVAPIDQKEWEELVKWTVLHPRSDIYGKIPKSWTYSKS